METAAASRVADYPRFAAPAGPPARQPLLRGIPDAEKKNPAEAGFFFSP
jgi:hypothetical protein